MTRHETLTFSRTTPSHSSMVTLVPAFQMLLRPKNYDSDNWSRTVREQEYYDMYHVALFRMITSLFVQADQPCAALDVGANSGYMSASSPPRRAAQPQRSRPAQQQHRVHGARLHSTLTQAGASQAAQSRNQQSCGHSPTWHTVHTCTPIHSLSDMWRRLHL